MNGYYLNQANNCSKCKKGCKRCMNESFCTECEPNLNL
jgi:hypothetical protein